jgi:NADH-quinone oxidoreductase subunit H
METVYQYLMGVMQSAPGWLITALSIAIPIGFILTVYPFIFAYTTLIERKALGRIQNRYGPNRVGPYGIFQPIADGLKLLTKEDIVPRRADQFVHFLAPVIGVFPSVLLFAVLPVAPGLVPVDLNIGVLFVFAVSTATVLALFMGGWASRNKFSLLGAMRAVAQVVSYEVPMVLSVVVVLMAVGSLSTVAIVENQRGLFGWHIFQPWGFFGFVLFVIGAMAESARTPFDIPEAESEIIAGYHTEYSGFKFALFQMGEYLATLAMAGITVTLFLGGYLGPGSSDTAVGRLLSMLWFFSKVMVIVFVIIWIRGTWPRIRVDQLLGFAWKVLLPLSILNIFACAISHFVPTPWLGWCLSALFMLISYRLLTQFNAGETFNKRTYRYVT